MGRKVMGPWKRFQFNGVYALKTASFQRIARPPKGVVHPVQPSGYLPPELSSSESWSKISRSCTSGAAPENIRFPGVHLFLWTGKVKTMLSRLVRAIRQFVQGEDGPTAVEYAVMLALIIVVCITAIQALGTNANTTFTETSNVMANVGP